VRVLLATLIRAVFWGTFSARMKHPEQDVTNTEAITAAATNRPLTAHLHSHGDVDVWVSSHRFFYQSCGRLRE
jgi:hypothetical protein